jgi:hypothetical protein
LATAVFTAALTVPAPGRRSNLPTPSRAASAGFCTGLDTRFATMSELLHRDNADSAYLRRQLKP